MTIQTDFACYINEIMSVNRIRKGMAEYERAKCVLPNDLSIDEYQRAVKLAAKWCVKL